MQPEEKPIIVCGPARSGTTAVQRMLLTHPDISIAREVPPINMPSLKPLLAETARHQREEWTEERRAEVVRALWFALSRPMRGKTVTRRWGMKTTWSELDSDLWDSLVDPAYVYVLRRGDRVFQSHIRLGWHRGEPIELIAKYKRSVRAFERLRVKGSAHIVQLDLADTPEARQRIAEETFAFLGEDPKEREPQFFAKFFSTRFNQPTSALGEEPELPEEWREILATDREYQELMDSHGYGIESSRL